MYIIHSFATEQVDLQSVVPVVLVVPVVAPVASWCRRGGQRDALKWLVGQYATLCQYATLEALTRLEELLLPKKGFCRH